MSSLDHEQTQKILEAIRQQKEQDQEELRQSEEAKNRQNAEEEARKRQAEAEARRKQEEEERREKQKAEERQRLDDERRRLDDERLQLEEERRRHAEGLAVAPVRPRRQREPGPPEPEEPSTRRGPYIALASVAALIVVLTIAWMQFNNGGAIGGGPVEVPTLFTSEQLFPVIENGRLGYMNLQGQIIIGPRYDANWLYNTDGSINWMSALFVDGRAAIKLGDEWGYIDSTGATAFPGTYDRAWDFSEGLALVRDGRKRGYIDSTGAMIIEPQFDTGYRFSEGLAAVQMGDEYGYINQRGRWAFPARFKRAYSFSEGRAIVRLGDDGTERGFINTSGDVVTRDHKDAWKFSEEVAPVQDKETNLWGYINKQGSEVIPKRYDDARPFHEGRAAVRIGDQYGFIDHNGGTVIAPQFASVGNFAKTKDDEALAWVQEADGQYGYINKRGRMVIDAEFDRAYDFARGLALVEDNGQLGYIDTEGNYVWQSSR